MCVCACRCSPASCCFSSLLVLLPQWTMACWCSTLSFTSLAAPLQSPTVRATPPRLYLSPAHHPAALGPAAQCLLLLLLRFSCSLCPPWWLCLSLCLSVLLFASPRWGGCRRRRVLVHSFSFALLCPLLVFLPLSCIVLHSVDSLSLSSATRSHSAFSNLAFPPLSPPYLLPRGRCHPPPPPLALISSLPAAMFHCTCVGDIRRRFHTIWTRQPSSNLFSSSRASTMTPTTAAEMHGEQRSHKDGSVVVVMCVCVCVCKVEGWGGGESALAQPPRTHKQTKEK